MSFSTRSGILCRASHCLTRGAQFFEFARIQRCNTCDERDLLFTPRTGCRIDGGLPRIFFVAFAFDIKDDVNLAKGAFSLL